MDLPLVIGLAITLLIAIAIVCSVIISSLGQDKSLVAVRQDTQPTPNLSNQETNLLLALRREWLRDEILPLSLEAYNCIMMPDRKLIITLNRPAQEPAIKKTGWLVLELKATELEQAPQETARLIQKFLQNPRLAIIERNSQSNITTN